MEGIELETPSGTPSKRSTRSDYASRKSIPGAITSSSPMALRLKERRSRDAQSKSMSGKQFKVPREKTPRRTISVDRVSEPPKARKTYTASLLEESLCSCEQNMKNVHSLTVRHLLHDAREAEAMREQLFVDTVSPFGSLQCIQLQPNHPVRKGAYAENIDSYVSQATTVSSNQADRFRSWVARPTYIITSWPRVEVL